MKTLKGMNGWTLIETAVLIAIIIILAIIFFPRVKGTYFVQEGENCAKASEIHKMLIPDIKRLITIVETPEPGEESRSMRAFRASESGKIFFEEFCPALLGCEESLEIKWQYSIPLTLLCKEE